MKNIFVLFFVFFSIGVFSQYELKVLKAIELSPIPNASVYCNGKLLGTTNTAGLLKFNTKCKKVEVQAKGYYEGDVVVDKVMEIILEQAGAKTGIIEKVVLNDKSDARALEILNKVNEKYFENSPKSLDTYSYNSYEKISLDLDQDTISHYSRYITNRVDSLQKLPKNNVSLKQGKDSLDKLNINKLMAQSKMFLWERAMLYMFSQKFGDKVTVLDNRVSGIDEPLYQMLAVRSNRSKMPKEILPANRNLYRFYLTDTISIDGRENFVIRFREVSSEQNFTRRKFNGYLYIDQETYGIKKIESHSPKQNEGSVTSIWSQVANKWFLQKEDMKLKIGNTSFKESQDDKKDKKKFGYYVYRTADYSDFKTNFESDAKDFKGYTMDVQNADGSLMHRYRTYPLTDREKLTYTKIDSLGARYKLTQKATFIASLLKGNIRLGMVNVDAGKLLVYNGYEGFRMGLALKMNESFHKYISPDFYVAYGFKDNAVKYGAGVDLKTTLKKNSFFRAEYYDDVISAGRFNENMWSFRMKFLNAGLDQQNDKFYSYKGFKFSYENDLSNALSMRLSAAKDKEEALFDYDFRNMGNSFQNFAAMITLKYAPKSKNIMTPAGKHTYENNFPEFFLNYKKGMKAFGGDFNFHKIDFMTTQVFKSKIGTTGLRSYSGIITGDAPIWHHFQMNGLGDGKAKIKFNFNSFLGFATMEAGKYYSDKFTAFYLTHHIPWYFKSFGRNTSSFGLIYRGIIGNMSNPEQHDFDFSKLDHLYQETGLEWKNFLSTKLNLGFFYRIGHYQTKNFKENFAIQIKLNALGF